MKSLYCQIKELHQKDWDYYSNTNNDTLSNPFTTSNPDHYEFIKEYFYRGGKEDIFKDDDLNIIDYTRHNHTNSVFFLGILLYKETSIKKFLIEENVNFENQFSFIWFLTCLFHDYAFEKEDPSSRTQDNKHLEIEKIKNYDSLAKSISVKRHVTSLKDNNNVFFNSIKNYLKYRLILENKIDHGILAGTYMFDRLVKIRIEKKKSNDKTLNWDKEIEKLYAIASITIATHNIWLPKKEDVQKYIHFGLNDLINFKPIKLKESPFFYLFGLVDTLDPIKAYSMHYKDEYILDKIEVEFKPYSILFKNKITSKLDFNVLVKKSDNLIGWLDVSITKEENSLLIRMK